MPTPVAALALFLALAGDLIPAIRKYAETYVATLPDFICTRTTTHYDAGRKSEKRRKRQVVQEQLSYVDGHEHASVMLLNNKVPKGPVPSWRFELSTEGEFGSALRELFDPDRQAVFVLQPDGQVAFEVPQRHSTLRISAFGVSAYVGYHGTIKAKPDGTVLELRYVTDGIPEELQTESMETTIDYAPVHIGGSTYTLPAHAVIVETDRKQRIINDVRFDGYRKFGSESTIRFGDTP